MNTEALREAITNILYGNLTYQNYLAVPKVRKQADLKIEELMSLIKDHCYLKGEQGLPEIRGHLIGSKMLCEKTQQDMLQHKFWPVQEIE